jgi:23S rRNA (adenine2503-C2)-methyltransferase
MPFRNAENGLSEPGDSSAERMHLPGVELFELRAWLVGQGQPRYRAEQILAWVYQHGADNFDAMSNLPKTLRAWLAERVVIYRAGLGRESVSADGTHKLLLSWPDGATTETVWIPAERRNTACLSTQIGCPVGCRFCASGLDGLQRNLTAGEIVEQALRIGRLVVEQGGAQQGGERLTHVVIMGIGEPLANCTQLVKALRIMNASWGLGIGARRITVSTVGLPKQIRWLAEQGLPVNLALSLHAPDDALRRELIPWAGRVPIADLIDACWYYFQSTGREVTLEYVLLDGANMRLRHAEELAKIARRLRANVNLLRYNPVAGLPYQRPTAEAAYAFQQRLRERGVNAHVRSSRGKDVDAACGQLRRLTRDG